jgi:polyisoprenoid-binding protein YceI
MNKITAVLFVLLLSAASLVSQPTTWKIDPVHSKVLFSVSHMVISEVSGRFNDFDATLVQTKEDFTDSKLSATIKTKSIDTDNDRRDNHLRSADFFDAEKNPEITFVSRKFEKTGKDIYKITGDLTIRGVTKSVVLDMKFNGQVKSPMGNFVAGFKATTTINRMDYGVKWNKTMELGGLIVGENVDITLNVELTKQTVDAKK